MWWRTRCRTRRFNAILQLAREGRWGCSRGSSPTWPSVRLLLPLTNSLRLTRCSTLCSAWCGCVLRKSLVYSVWAFYARVVRVWWCSMIPVSSSSPPPPFQSMYDTLTHPTADRVAVMPSPSAAIEREALEVILSFVEIHHEYALGWEFARLRIGFDVT